MQLVSRPQAILGRTRATYVSTLSDPFIMRAGRVQPEHAIAIAADRQQSVEPVVGRLVSVLLGPTKANSYVVSVEGSSCDDEQFDLHDAAACARLGASKLSAASPDTRQAALELLMRDDGVLRTAAIAVAALLEDSVWYVRRAAVDAIARLSPLADVYMQALIGRLVDDSTEVRIAAVRALLQHVDAGLSEAAVAALVGACADEDWGVRAAAVRTLGEEASGRGGPISASVEAAVAARLHDAASGVRAAAAVAIGQHSAAGGARDAATEQRHFEALRTLTQDPDAPVREAAERVLRCFVHAATL